MKFFAANHFFTTLLVFVAANMVLLSIGVSAGSMSINICKNMSEETDCTEADDSCRWIDGNCLLLIFDGCEAIGEKCGCIKTGCTWLDNGQGRGTCGSEEIVIETCKAVANKRGCNSSKGCVWRKKCLTATSQLQCADFSTTKKKTCRSSGCEWSKKQKTCAGRPERKLLKGLKGKKGADAKNIINAEYCDLYLVQTIKLGEFITDDFVPNRIRLFVNAKGIVMKVPKFG